MPTNIIRHIPEDSKVEAELLMQEVERNRARIRTISGMLLAFCAILSAVCIAFSLYAADDLEDQILASFSAGAAVVFAASAAVATFLRFLRKKGSESTEGKFVSDLLELLSTELRLMRMAVAAMISGLFLISLGISLFLAVTWRL